MLLLFTYFLESTDAAPEVPHPRPTRHDAGRNVRRSCPRVGPCLLFFFSRIHADLARFATMRLDSCRCGFNSHRTGLIRPKSGHIRHIESYRPAADMAEIAETCLLSFFCESRHSNVFFKNILIVKIYRKYK